MHDRDCRNSSVPPLLRLLAYLTCDTHKVRVQYRSGCYACLLFHKQEHCSEAAAPGLVSRLPSYLLTHRHCLPAQGSFIHRPGCAVYKKLARRPDHPKNHTPAHKDWQPRRVPPPQTLNHPQLHPQLSKPSVPSGPFITEKETKKYRKQQEKPVRRPPPTLRLPLSLAPDRRLTWSHLFRTKKQPARPHSPRSWSHTPTLLPRTSSVAT